MMNISREEVDKRWQLVLGAVDPEMDESEWSEKEKAQARVLEYIFPSDQSRPSKGRNKIQQWLKDMRSAFNQESKAFLQKTAIEQLQMHELLLEEEFLGEVQPNVQLLADILQLSPLMDDRQKDLARQWVKRVVEEVEKRIKLPTLQQVRRGLKRQIHRRQQHQTDIHWHKTIQANLKNFQPEYRTIIPEVWKGYQKAQPSLKDVYLLIDQSASMSESVIYSTLFGSILSSIRSLRTRVVLFDSEVVDVSEHVHDIVDLLMGLQLGGGTDIGHALSYISQIITRPRNSLLFLISDLEDTGDGERTFSLFQKLIHQGVNCYNIVALTDEGRPSYDSYNAQKLARIGVPFGYCTPDQFPQLLEDMIRE